MIKPEHKVLFVQPLIHKFGIQRAEMLNDMLGKIDAHMDQTTECSVAAVADPSKQKFTTAAQNTDQLLVQLVLARVLINSLIMDQTAKRKKDGWSLEQIQAEVSASDQYAKALSYEWGLFPGWEPDEVKGVPIQSITTVLKALNELSNGNIGALLKEFHKQVPPPGKADDAV